MLSTSCCPGYVGFIKKKHPELERLVSHTPSPMVVTGLWLKEKEPDAKVVFIGPCIAKKKEFQLGRTRNAVDSVLTYEELCALFDSCDIDLTKLAEEPLDEASSHGRKFARTGGVTAAVEQLLQEKGIGPDQFDFKPVVCNGISECNLALLKAQKGVLDGNFIEGMACEGGCVQGAGCLIRSPKNRMEVENHAKQAGERTIGQAVAAAREEQPAQEKLAEPAGK